MIYFAADFAALDGLFSQRLLQVIRTATQLSEAQVATVDLQAGSIVATVQVASGDPVVAVTAAVDAGGICMTIGGQINCASNTNSPNYCHPNPCKNSATCSDIGSGAVCTCTESFCGDCCAQLADPTTCPGSGDQLCGAPAATKSGSSSTALAIGAGVGAGIGLLISMVLVVVWVQRRKQVKSVKLAAPYLDEFANPIYVPSRSQSATGTYQNQEPYPVGVDYSQFNVPAYDTANNEDSYSMPTYALGSGPQYQSLGSAQQYALGSLDQSDGAQQYSFSSEMQYTPIDDPPTAAQYSLGNEAQYSLGSGQYHVAVGFDSAEPEQEWTTLGGPDGDHYQPADLSCAYDNLNEPDGVYSSSPAPLAAGQKSGYIVLDTK